jgi:hypothetical protein
MDADDNLKLIRYYKNRTVWLAEPDQTPARITPYGSPEQQTVAAH